MTILVTGATGFLGHNLVPCLVEAGYQVRALVRETSDTTFLESMGVEIVVGHGIQDVPVVNAACQGCDYVIHAAGHFRFWGEFSDFWQTNVAGTGVVLDAALAAGVKRFVHVSTIAVVGRTPATDIIDENTACYPLDPYQTTKLEAEKLVLLYHQKHQLPTIILRPGAFYGPWGHYAFNRLFFEEPLRGWRIRVNKGQHITFPVFVPDVAQAILLALQGGRVGEIYNISSPSIDHNTVNAIVSDMAGINHWRLNIPTSLVLLLARAWTVLSRFTRQEPFYPINMAPYVFQDWRVSAQKAEDELGFRPTPFLEGVRQTLTWYWQTGLIKQRKP